MGIKILKKKNYIIVYPPKKLKCVSLVTEPYPGFPTDLQAQIMVLMTRAEGVSIIKEKIFENRFMHVSELRRMGAHIDVEGNKAKIYGNSKLNGAELMATDLRASVCLVLAGLTAYNKTIVNRINGFAFLMIVAAACVLLIVLSAFEGLKDFGLFYTSSFDPDYKVVPKKGKYLFLDREALDKIRGLDGVLGASEIIEEKVVFSNELNSGATILKGVFTDYHLTSTLDSLSLVGVFSPEKKNTIYIGADLASSLEVVLSKEFSLLAFLMRAPGRVLTRTQILEQVWGYHFDPGTNLVDVYIRRLRSKIDIEGELTLIETLRVVVYRMQDPDNPEEG